MSTLGFATSSHQLSDPQAIAALLQIRNALVEINDTLKKICEKLPNSHE